MNDYQTLLKEYYEFACQVHWLLKAQEEAGRLKYSRDAEKREDALLEASQLKKQVKADIEDVVTRYEEEYL